MTFFPGSRAAIAQNQGQITFKLFGSGSDSGYMNLVRNNSLDNTTITFNATSSLGIGGLWLGHNATPNGWTASFGPNLDQFGTGPSITASNPVPFTNIIEKTVDFGAGKSFFCPSSTTTYNLGANTDIVVEVVFCANNINRGADNAIIGKYQGAASTGWLLYENAGQLKIIGLANTALANLTNNNWYYLLVAANRDNTIMFSINGFTNGSTLALGNTLDNTNNFEIGSYNLGSGKSDFQVAYAAVWTGSLGNPLQSDFNTIAQQRFSQLAGAYPQIATVGAYTPQAINRTTVATIDTIIDESTNNRQLFIVPKQWPRVQKRAEINTGRPVVGYLAEAGSTNLLLWSQDFIDSHWTIANGFVSGNVTGSLDGLLSASVLVPDTTNNLHYIYQTVTPTATGKNSFSVFAKQGTRPFITLMLTGAIDSFAQSFDLQNGVLGTALSGTTNATIETYGNGWYRCNISPNLTNNTLQYRALIYTSKDTSNASYNGTTNEQATYIFGAQLENGVPFASSYMPTQNATVTRDFDDLRYSISNNFVTGGTATIDLSVLLTSSVATNNTCLSIGNVSSNSIIINCQPNKYIFNATANGVSRWAINGLTNPYSSNKVRFRGTIQNGNQNLYTNGASEGTPATSTTLVFPTSSIFIGEREVGNIQLNGIISDIIFRNRFLGDFR